MEKRILERKILSFFDLESMKNNFDVLKIRLVNGQPDRHELFFEVYDKKIYDIKIFTGDREAIFQDEDVKDFLTSIVNGLNMLTGNNYKEVFVQDVLTHLEKEGYYLLND